MHSAQLMKKTSLAQQKQVHRQFYSLLLQVENANKGQYLR